MFVNKLKKDLANAHLRQQAARVARLFVIAFVAQLAALGTDHLGRKALLGVAVGAAEATWRQLVPVVPWSVLARKAGPVSAVVPGADGSGASA